MVPGRFRNFILLMLVLLAQSWGTGVLLLSRQVESLAFLESMACVFWAWCLWSAFLERRRGELLLPGIGLILTLTCLVPCLVDILTDTELPLVHEALGAVMPLPRLPLIPAPAIGVILVLDRSWV